MAGDPRLFTPRSPILSGRARVYTPGYTPMARLRRVTEDGSPRVLETLTDYRVAERNTTLV